MALIRQGRYWQRCVISAGLVLALSAAVTVAHAAEPAPRTQTGLPLPRFASLKVDRVNLRQGPGTDYPVAWVFRRAGLPVEILREFEGWRQVRDAEGATGWVQGAALSGRRTVVVTPWDVKPASQPPPVPMQAEAREGAAAVALIEPNVVAAIVTCDGRWCRISVDDVRGYIAQAKLWGVYPGEAIK